MLNITYDPPKKQSNFNKHRRSLEEAKEIFADLDDPFLWVTYSKGKYTENDGSLRAIVISKMLFPNESGEMEPIYRLCVIHLREPCISDASSKIDLTKHGEVRVISMRRANEKEIIEYEKYLATKSDESHGPASEAVGSGKKTPYQL